MATVPGQAAAEQSDEAGYPESWLWSEHGDHVVGSFVRFDEGATREFGAKVIMVLAVDGRERSVWLNQTALFNKVRDELNRRGNKRLESGERVVVQRLSKKKSENGRDYWPFTVSFPDRPEKSTTELFDLNEGPKAYTEPKREPEPASQEDADDGIPF